LVINQKEEFVKTNQKSIIECLHKIFSSDQTLTVVIDSIKPNADENKTEVNALKACLFDVLNLKKNILKGCFLRKSTCFASYGPNESNFKSDSIQSFK